MDEFSDPLRQQARQQRRMARLQAMSGPSVAAQPPSQPTDIARLISNGIGGHAGWTLGGLAAGGLTAASLIPGPIGIGAKVARMALPVVGGLMGSALAPAAVDAVSPSIHSGVNKAFQNAGPYSAPAAAATIGGMYLLNRGRRSKMAAATPATAGSGVWPSMASSSAKAAAASSAAKSAAKPSARPGPTAEMMKREYDTAMQTELNRPRHARLTLNPVPPSGPGPAVRTDWRVRPPKMTDIGPHPESLSEIPIRVRGHLPHKGPGVLLRNKTVSSVKLLEHKPATTRRLGHTPDTLEFATNPTDIRKMSPAQLLKIRHSENARIEMIRAALEDAGMAPQGH